MDAVSPVSFEGPLDYLRLTIDRYEDPEVIDNDWDANFILIASFDAMVRGRTWSVRELSVITFELEYLANWLDDLPSGEDAPDLNDSFEPYLRFDRLSDETIRLRFFEEAAPPWADKAARKSGEYGFDILIDDRLKAAAAQLRAQMNNARNGVKLTSTASKTWEGCLDWLFTLFVCLAVVLFIDVVFGLQFVGYFIGITTIALVVGFLWVICRNFLPEQLTFWRGRDAPE